VFDACCYNSQYSVCKLILQFTSYWRLNVGSKPIDNFKLDLNKFLNSAVLSFPS
jgi:hypothetical protein